MPGMADDDDRANLLQRQQPRGIERIFPSRMRLVLVPRDRNREILFERGLHQRTQAGMRAHQAAAADRYRQVQSAIRHQRRRDLPSWLIARERPLSRARTSAAKT